MITAQLVALRPISLPVLHQVEVMSQTLFILTMAMVLCLQMINQSVLILG